jgi:zinc protease
VTVRRLPSGVVLLGVVCAACVLPPAAERAPLAVPASPVPTVVTESRLVIPMVHEATLSNGLRVLNVERPDTQDIHLAFADRVATDVGEAGHGLAFLTALTVRESARRAPEAIAVNFLDRAVETSVNGAGTVVTLNVLPADAVSGFEALARIVQKPSLDADAIGRARSLATTSNAGEVADKYASLRRLALRTLYGKANFYAHFRSASEAERSRLRDTDIRHFYATRFRPKDSALLVVGSLSTADVVALARRNFESWSPAPSSEIFTDESWQPVPVGQRPKGIEVDTNPSDGDATLLVVLPCPRRNSPESVAADLAATLLGQLWTSGLHARLRHDFASSYFVTANCWQDRAGGTFEILLDTDPEQLGAALDTINLQLEQLAGWPPSESDLNRARSLYLGNHALSFSTNYGIENMLVDQFMDDLPNDYTATLEARVLATAPKDIQSFAKRYLDPSNMVVTVEGNSQAIGSPLSRMGGVVWEQVDDLQSGE